MSATTQGDDGNFKDKKLQERYIDESKGGWKYKFYKNCIDNLNPLLDVVWCNVVLCICSCTYKCIYVVIVIMVVIFKVVIAMVVVVVDVVVIVVVVLVVVVLMQL